MPLSSDFLAQFKSEVQKSLLLEEADKQYWLENAEKLPVSLIKAFFEELKKKNNVMNSYIQAAVDADPSLISELKNQLRSIQSHILKLKEKSESSGEKIEETLESQLKQI